MPLLGPTIEGRNQVFQTLKPQCVALSQAALSSTASKRNINAVTDGLQQLQSTLTEITIRPHALDPKLADYVFFPVSHVLKSSKTLPIRSLELCLQCLSILVQQGWRQSIQPQLAAQVVIMCTLMAERRPNGFSFTKSTDELQQAAFSCLHAVFESSCLSKECQALFRDEANFPQLGQTITVILDGIEGSGTTEVQVAATDALKALVNGVADREICASFLPGIVSKLAKILRPSTHQRRNHAVLTQCLDLLSVLLKNTLSDDVKLVEQAGKGSKTMIDEQWKQNAATQLKPALTSIMRLQDHSRDDVRDALARLCLLVLEHCSKTLANCSSLALETLIILSTTGANGYARIRLGMLLKVDPSLPGLLQTSLHDWLQSLSTVMQSADEEAKVRKLAQISTAYNLLVDSGLNTATIDRMLSGNLRDSVIITLQSRGLGKQAAGFVEPMQSLDLTVLNTDQRSTDVSQPLVKYRGQEEIMSRIEGLAKLVTGSPSGSPTFVADLARSLRYSQGEQQIANFWLLLTATQTALQQNDSVDDLLGFGGNESYGEKASYAEYMEELYTFALATLNSSSDDEESPDPRLQALALRTLALRAQTAGEDFRYELIDALYPVLHTLSTPDESLQRDSITTLNIFTQACGYVDVKELIVENVDYLTNAVALKLNAFDISPQAPQVLLMMVRLAGASLVPYLEDTVESIFAVLESYHGYGLLVELLFRVLAVVAEEGAKAPMLADDRQKRLEANDVVRERWQPASVAELADQLREKAAAAARDGEQRQELEAHPQRPWKKVEEVDDDAEDQDVGEQDDEEQAMQQHNDEDPPPPAPKTYNLLLKITDLTQHFLPSASPSLRASLLSLIRTTVPAIAKHENSFLPLINTLWPEITSRLEDAEPHVQATALEIIGVLCEYAGDFMRSRIVQLWPLAEEMWRHAAQEIVDAGKPNDGRYTKRKMAQEQSMALVSGTGSLKQAVARLESSPADYTNTSVRLLWNALADTLTIIVRHVPLPAELFDEAVHMLAPILEREDVRVALGHENADAFWLARLRSGAIATPAMPIVPNGAGWTFAAVPG